MALRVFSHQYAASSVYRRFCDSRGVTPGDLDDWQAIPAFPAEGFKGRIHDSEDGAVRVFLSSGTTRGASERSRHPVFELDTYKASALAHFSDMVLPDEPGPMATLVIGPTAATHPESSLGQMFSWCTELADGRPVLSAFDSQGRLDVEEAIAWLRQRAEGTFPTLLLGVSSAFTTLFAELRKRGLELRLPADSRLVDTGGRKGESHVLSARGLVKAAWTYLHVPGYLCVNEYGMTEMLSQFYDDCVLNRFRGRLSKRAKVGPAWVETVVVDPSTLAPVPAGEVGILKHFDLANWESVSALQTLDLGRVRGDGFEMLGRAALAEARGCSQLMRALVE